jgi:hypothetical protein
MEGKWRARPREKRPELEHASRIPICHSPPAQVVACTAPATAALGWAFEAISWLRIENFHFLPSLAAIACGRIGLAWRPGNLAVVAMPRTLLISDSLRRPSIPIIHVCLAARSLKLLVLTFFHFRRLLPSSRAVITTSENQRGIS